MLGLRAAVLVHPGGGLDEVGLGREREEAGVHNELVRLEAGGLDDDFQYRAVPVHHRSDLLDVAEHQLIEPGLHVAAVDHHVDLLAAELRELLGLEDLAGRGDVTEREAHDAADLGPLVLQLLQRELRVAAVHAHRREVVVDGLLAKLLDLAGLGVLAELSVVDVLRDARRGAALERSCGRDGGLYELLHVLAALLNHILHYL